MSPSAPEAPMSELIPILSPSAHGGSRTAGQLLPQIYDELRQLAAYKLAQEKTGQTLQPTALVHEAYIRLLANGDATESGVQRWDSPGHFFASAAEAMRRILIDRAREKRSQKRGGGRKRLNIDAVDVVAIA